MLAALGRKKKQRQKKRAGREKGSPPEQVSPILPVFHLWSSLSSRCHRATSQRTSLLWVLGQGCEQVGCPRLPLFYSSDPPVFKTNQTCHFSCTFLHFCSSVLSQMSCIYPLCKVLFWTLRIQYSQQTEYIFALMGPHTQQKGRQIINKEENKSAVCLGTSDSMENM